MRRPWIRAQAHPGSHTPVSCEMRLPGARWASRVPRWIARLVLRYWGAGRIDQRAQRASPSQVKRLIFPARGAHARSPRAARRAQSVPANRHSWAPLPAQAIWRRPRKHPSPVFARPRARYPRQRDGPSSCRAQADLVGHLRKPSCAAPLGNSRRSCRPVCGIARNWPPLARPSPDASPPARLRRRPLSAKKRCAMRNFRAWHREVFMPENLLCQVELLRAVRIWTRRTPRPGIEPGSSA